VWCSAW